MIEMNRYQQPVRSKQPGLSRPTPSNTMSSHSPLDSPFGRRPQAKAARAEPAKVKVEFKYTFQEYLKLALCKAIPQAGIIIDPQEGFIFGAREDCLQLKKKVQRELRVRQYKKVQLRRQHDLDEIEYELDSKFSARIFRPAYIEKALATLALYNCFETPCAKFRDILHQKIIVILRINAEFSEECMGDLEKILRKSLPAQTHRQKQQHAPYRPIVSRPPPKQQQQEEEYEVVEEDEVNYYQLKAQGKQEEVPEDRSSLDESFSWTKTESSQFEQEQDDLNTSCVIEEGTHSFS